MSLDEHRARFDYQPWMYDREKLDSTIFHERFEGCRAGDGRKGEAPVTDVKVRGSSD